MINKKNYRYEISHIYAFLDGVKGIHTNDEGALRLFIEAVWFGVRSGCQWRLLPESYENWRGVHEGFKRWAEAGIWERLMHHVAKPDTQEVMMDATIVRSHACASGYGKNTPDQQALGRSKGGFTTKILPIVDALGTPLHFIVKAVELQSKVWYRFGKRIKHVNESV